MCNEKPDKEDCDHLRCGGLLGRKAYTAWEACEVWMGWVKGRWMLWRAMRGVALRGVALRGVALRGVARLK